MTRKLLLAAAVLPVAAALTLETVLPELRDRGYRVVTLSELAGTAEADATVRSPARTPPPPERR